MVQECPGDVMKSPLFLYVLLILDTSSWKVATFRFADDKLSLCITFHENRDSSFDLLDSDLFDCFDLFSTDFEFEEHKEHVKENEDCKNETTSESALNRSVGRFQQIDEEKLCFYGEKTAIENKKEYQMGIENLLW